MSSVNSLVGGMNQIREETQALRKVKTLPPNDLFIEVMEVQFIVQVHIHRISFALMSDN